MGKATNPAKARHKANAEQKAKGGIERVNGVDNNTLVSPVVAWRAKRMLEDSHEAAIARCWYLWDLLAHEPRTTANYGEQMAKQTADGESESMILRRIEAKEDLQRIESHMPRKYWQVFENCVRFDEPTGIIGSKLYGGTKTARAKAYTIVCFVADIICDKERLLR